MICIAPKNGENQVHKKMFHSFVSLQQFKALNTLHVLLRCICALKVKSTVLIFCFIG